MGGENLMEDEVLDLPATCPQCFATRGRRVAMLRHLQAGRNKNLIRRLRRLTQIMKG